MEVVRDAIAANTSSYAVDREIFVSLPGGPGPEGRSTLPDDFATLADSWDD